MSQLIVTRKPQVRAETTRTKILDAAQSLFSERGFEHTQMDEVAVRAGCSRGGIYAHYESKEDLFLALMEHRASSDFRAACKKLEDEPELARRRELFKGWFVSQVCAPGAGTLTLEFKQYAVRRPEIRDKLLVLFNSLFTRADQDLREVLFGEHLTEQQRLGLDQRLSVLGGALSSMVLERKFRPNLLSPGDLRPLAEEMFDALFHL